MKAKSKDNFLMGDVLVILLSFLVAVIFLKVGVFAEILSLTKGFEFLNSFIAGMFFTSVFTTSPAIVALSEIAKVNGIFYTAILGSAGAVVGDLIIFRFIRDRFSAHVLELAQHAGIVKKFRVLLKLKYFRWFTFLVGGLIIASPLPDELGISILGLSKMKMMWFVPLSYAFNFIGILLIGTITQIL